MELESFQAVAAVASAIAAAFSAWAAVSGPKRAAEAAEFLRQKNENAHEERRVKLWVFAALLGDRRHWLCTVESIRALNTIDLAFRGSVEVRESWSRYQQVLDSRRELPNHEVEFREDALLAEMAKDLGLSSEIRGSDFGKFSNPMWRTTIHHAAIMQAKKILDNALENGPSPLSTELGTQAPSPEPKSAVPSDDAERA